MSLSDFADNLGNSLGFGKAPERPDAPRLDSNEFSYGGNPAMAQNLANSTFALADTARRRGAMYVNGTEGQYDAANQTLADAAKTYGYGAANANANQQMLMSNLAATAQGQGGPSAAQLAMRQQSEDAMRQQLAMAATNGSPASMIAAQNNNALQQGQLTQQLGVQRANEMAQARGELANVVGQNQQYNQAQAALMQAQAGQQIGMAQFNAGNQQQANLANQQARLGQQQLNDQTALANMNAGLGVMYNQAQLNAQRQGMLNEQYATQMGQYGEDKKAASSGIGATLGMAAGAMAMMSDIRAKKDIAPAGEDISNAYRQLSGSSYGYINPDAYGQGTHYGPMAQELVQTPAGASTVVPTPNGLAVDTGRVAMMNASETAKQRREIDALKTANAMTVDPSQSAGDADFGYQSKAAARDAAEAEKKKKQEAEEKRQGGLMSFMNAAGSLGHY